MIVLKNISKRYGNIDALRDVSLEVPQKEILALIGPSGCGKTTLLRIIAGFERPDQGKVLIKGVPVSASAQIVQPHERKLSMIFQDLALWPHMTVREHIAFVIKKERMDKALRNSQTTRILKNINLNHHYNRYPHQLSGGEKQRLAIARSLAQNPEYLLMDEPFSNLDAILKEEVEQVLLRIKDRLQMGIIYVSHHVEEVLAMADRIAVMNKGTLIQIDTKKHIFENPRDEFVRKILKT